MHTTQVAYFRYCREIMTEQAHKTHLTATEHYREAKEFARWSAKDRAEKRAELPPLTPEQKERVVAYMEHQQSVPKPGFPTDVRSLIQYNHGFAVMSTNSKA